MSYFIDIPNNTHYIAENYKSHNRLVNPRNFLAQQNRQLGYFIRCYYHHKYVSSQGGLTLFYTLTYNNKALPHFFGVPTVDYYDLRYLLSSSGLNKTLIRHYGCRLQYLVTCELGDGKGSRGEANNPHYHVLFFVIPDFEYQRTHTIEKITPLVFKSLIEKYWCGNVNLSPKLYKYGIAVAGDNHGVVDSISAINYVCKYVLKDSVYYTHFARVKSATIAYIKKRLLSMHLFRTIYYNRRNKNFNFENDPFVKQFAERIFTNVYLKLVRNRFIPKVRISHGVGLSALDNINSDGITINVPTKTKIKQYRIPLYLFRKKYYKIVKDGSNNNKYILNDAGLSFMCKNISNVLESKFQTYKSIINSSTNIYSDSLIRLYTEYDVVYRYRYQSTPFDVVDVMRDYCDFIYPDYYKVLYTDDIESSYVKYKMQKRTGYYLYNSYFSPLVKNLENLDNIINNYYICQSEERERIYTLNRAVKKNEALNKVKQYFL